MLAAYRVAKRSADRSVKGDPAGFKKTRTKTSSVLLVVSLHSLKPGHCVRHNDFTKQDERWWVGG